MSTTSQRAEIARHLKAGKSITPLEALHKWGVFRLGARIFELRARGMKIDRVMVKRGEKRFASYFHAA